MLLTSIHSEATTIVMFSGGRDSTVATLRLDEAGIPLTLVTITSKHLEGIDHVKARLKELQSILPKNTAWIQIEQPDELLTDTSFYDMTCLPCHHAYVVVSAAIAKSVNAKKIAFGYTRYQSDWPEQTPLAVKRLELTLKRHGIDLVLPVYDIDSREKVVEELVASGLSAESLEQKCLRQKNNVALSEERLKQQVDLWEKAIDESVKKLDKIEINVLSSLTIGDLKHE